MNQSRRKQVKRASMGGFKTLITGFFTSTVEKPYS